MTSIHIDTHQFVKGLVNAGIPEAQAEAILEGLERIDLKGVASKQDAAAIDHKISTLREDMKEMKADIFKWMFTSQFVAAGLIVGLIKLL